LTVFLLRLTLSFLLAFLIGRFFFPGSSAVKMVGFALILLALAYLFEHTRKKERGENDGT
jgi:membrane protein implicated in regulation of membrane protease activity